MIAHLRGTAHKMGVGEAVIDVQGVGYRVQTPIDVWEKLEEALPAALWISTYVREDRFDLFGFSDRQGQMLFEELLKLSGIGPKLGLELCAVPRGLLRQAVEGQDPGLLKNIKGVGRRTAEKLVVELKALLEKHPDMLGHGGEDGTRRPEYDRDAIAALTSLGYDSPAILEALRLLPSDLRTTEERVAAALRSL